MDGNSIIDDLLNNGNFYNEIDNKSSKKEDISTKEGTNIESRGKDIKEVSRPINNPLKSVSVNEEPTSKEEEEPKSDFDYDLMRYKLKAGKKLYKRNTGADFKPPIDKIPNNELEKRLTDMRLGISSGTSSKIIKSALDQAPSQYEKIMYFFNYDMGDFTKKCEEEDSDYQMIVEELAWEYSTVRYMSPEIRFVFMFLQGTWALGKKIEKPKLKISDVSKNVDSKYDDL